MEWVDKILFSKISRILSSKFKKQLLLEFFYHTIK
jgi:hypothetical protein